MTRLAVVRIRNRPSLSVCDNVGYMSYQFLLTNIIFASLYGRDGYGFLLYSADANATPTPTSSLQPGSTVVNNSGAAGAKLPNTTSGGGSAAGSASNTTSANPDTSKDQPTGAGQTNGAVAGKAYTQDVGSNNTNSFNYSYIILGLSLVILVVLLFALWRIRRRRKKSPDVYNNIGTGIVG